MNIRAWIDIDERLHEQVAALKHIDLYNRQYDEDEERKSHPYNTPAVFLEFGPTQWEENSNGIQSGPGYLRVHVVLQCYKDSHNLHKYTDQQKEALLQHYQIPKLVHKALQGWQACGTQSTFERITTTPDHDYNNIIVEVFEYAFTDIDTSADEQGDYETVRIEDVRAEEKP